MVSPWENETTQDFKDGNWDFVGLVCSKHDLEDEITFKSN
jgi:hypothetical protein